MVATQVRLEAELDRQSRDLSASVDDLRTSVLTASLSAETADLASSPSILLDVSAVEDSIDFGLQQQYVGRCAVLLAPSHTTLPARGKGFLNLFFFLFLGVCFCSACHQGAP